MRVDDADKMAVAVGGTAGYLRTRSTPSLVAGIGLGVSYAYAGMSVSAPTGFWPCTKCALAAAKLAPPKACLRFAHMLLLIVARLSH